jgi:hypothetical protein
MARMNEYDAHRYLAAARGVEPIPCPGAAPERLAVVIWNEASWRLWIALAFSVAGWVFQRLGYFA